MTHPHFTTRHRWLLWPHLALIIAATIAAYLRIIPGRFFELPYADKVGHFMLFGVLSFLLRGWIGVRNAIVLPLLAAGIEEIAQKASPYRTCSIWDYAADVAGVLTFQALALLRLPLR